MFIKSPENDVEKCLSALKSHPLEDLYGLYKTAWPEDFKEVSEIDLAMME